jgi:enterochelin esterase-like enzyme
MGLLRAAAAALCLATTAFAVQPFYDRTHKSEVLREERRYRIFLPSDYETSGKSYPVIYYFHGHSDRYTLEHYDAGKITVPRVAAWVATHPAIVVSVDGYVARDYTGFYGGAPWDVMKSGGDYDFGLYFRELVRHIDSTCRTLTDRRHRATSGLSMGGFMSLWLSARYPDLIGSASAFNPGPEFYVGDRNRRVLWRPKDHVSSHTASMIRLIRASGDYISQYHEETRDAYARSSDVDFEYRRDEYHKHAATSIEETFDFHARAFGVSALDNVPARWSYASPYRSFEVWGWLVEAQGDDAGFTYLDDVTQGGFRATTRRWAPDGPPRSADRRLHIRTAPLYSPGGQYTVLDHNLTTRATSTSAVTAGADGRLDLQLDAAGHQVSISGPGAGQQPPVLLPVTTKDKLRVQPQTDIALPVRIYNPRAVPLEDLKVTVASEYPTVALLAGSAAIPAIAPGKIADLSKALRVRFTAGAGYFEPARLTLAITYDGWHTTTQNIDVLVAPEITPEPSAVQILDGRTFTFGVFRQKGNQGGGASSQRTVTEGTGNGNGILEPGEQATIWVRLPQGMDPFDKNNWYRAKIFSDSPWITEIENLEEQKQLEWTSAKERTSVIRLAPETPVNTPVALLLDNESWSYQYTPDVRYGVEKLYQAFQLHTHHLHRYELNVGRPR